MIVPATQDMADLRRWLISAAIVLCAHGGMAAAMVTWREPLETAEPAAAIVIEFAPVPVAPANLRTEIPPGPEQVMSDAAPERPTQSIEEKLEEKIEQKVEAKLEQKREDMLERKAIIEPPPEVAPAPNPEIAIEPLAPQEIKQEAAQRQDARSPAPMTSAPQAVPVELAAIPAAPTQGLPSRNTSNAVPTWKIQVVSVLERNKRYPAAAQSRREQGVAQVFFSLDRKGRVVESRIVRSSGAVALDEEALALLRRAQPFPAPPAELPGERVDLSVPIRFNLK
jgi:protein TonB